MKSKVVYVCEHCGAEFLDASACEEHEAEQHYGMSFLRYLEWKKLAQIAKECGIARGTCRTQKTDANLNNAIKNLTAFESKHKVGFDYGLERPSNWL